MIKKWFFSTLFMAFLVPAIADGQVLYKCLDTLGRISYVDNKTRKNLKNCKPLSAPPLSTVPAHEGKARAAEALPTVSSTKIDKDTQRGRDNDRRRILEQELSNEQNNLKKAEQQLSEQEGLRNGNERNYQRMQERLAPYQETVDLHRRNIEALQKELAHVK
jgi:hypothetical protein